MNVAPNSLGIGRKQVRLGRLQARILYNWFHLIEYIIKVLGWVYIGDVPRIKDVIDVFKEHLTLDLWTK